MKNLSPDDRIELDFMSAKLVDFLSIEQEGIDREKWTMVLMHFIAIAISNTKELAFTLNLIFDLYYEYKNEPNPKNKMDRLLGDLE